MIFFDYTQFKLTFNCFTSIRSPNKDWSHVSRKQLSKHFLHNFSPGSPRIPVINAQPNNKWNTGKKFADPSKNRKNKHKGDCNSFYVTRKRSKLIFTSLRCAFFYFIMILISDDNFPVTIMLRIYFLAGVIFRSTPICSAI